MDVWVSAELESDVFDSFRLPNNELEDALKPYLTSKTYDIEPDSLDCIAIIRKDTDFEEHHRYSKNKRDMDFRLIIDYGEFKSASLQRRKKLILEMLIRAADILSEKKGVNKSAVQKLKDDLVEFGIMM